MRTMKHENVVELRASYSTDKNINIVLSPWCACNLEELFERARREYSREKLIFVYLHIMVVYHFITLLLIFSYSSNWWLGCRSFTMKQKSST